MSTNSTLPEPVPSAYREKKEEPLVHVGYDLTLTLVVMEQIRGLFAGLVPETLHAGPHNTAVLHISQQAKQSELHSWYRKASKNTNDEARVRSIYHRLIFSYDKQTNKPKSCQGMIVLYITVGPNHLYLNVFNNTGTRPFKVKELVSSGHFHEMKMTTPAFVTAVAYKK